MRCAICGIEEGDCTLFVYHTENGVKVHERVPVCKTCIRALITLRGYIEDSYRYLGAVE